MLLAGTSVWTGQEDKPALEELLATSNRYRGTISFQWHFEDDWKEAVELLKVARKHNLLMDITISREQWVWLKAGGLERLKGMVTADLASLLRLDEELPEDRFTSPVLHLYRIGGSCGRGC
ncbi:MAG: hypothetical protein Q7S03_02445 [bacterium]|nr:hypothetical protein [bacterium]